MELGQHARHGQIPRSPGIGTGRALDSFALALLPPAFPLQLVVAGKAVVLGKLRPGQGVVFRSVSKQFQSCLSSYDQVSSNSGQAPMELVGPLLLGLDWLPVVVLLPVGFLRAERVE